MHRKQSDRRARQRYLLTDFVFVRDQGLYYHLPTREWWTADEIDGVFPPIPMLVEGYDDETIH
jgi:hypothetical protein